MHPTEDELPSLEVCIIRWRWSPPFHAISYSESGKSAAVSSFLLVTRLTGLFKNAHDESGDMNLTKTRTLRLSSNCQLQAEMSCNGFFDWIKLKFNDPCGGKWVIAAPMDWTNGALKVIAGRLNKKRRVRDKHENTISSLEWNSRLEYVSF